MKFPIWDFFCKCDQICSFLRIWSHLPKKSLMESLLFLCSAPSMLQTLIFCYLFFVCLALLISITLSRKSDMNVVSGSSMSKLLSSRLTLVRSTLTHLFPMHPFSSPLKYQKTLRFSDVFRGVDSRERVLWERMG